MRKFDATKRLGCQMVRDYQDYLNDILDAADKVLGFTANMSYESFAGDEKTVYAVIRCLEIIGEASKHIPDDIRRQNPDIPWKEMAGARDVLIHDYFGVDVETIWKTVQENVTVLRPLVARMIQEHKKCAISNQSETN